MANPLRRMVSSSQVSDWLGQGSGNLYIPSRFQSLLNVEYLVVAGGGGAARAGGGAGGYRCSVSGENSGGGASAEGVLPLNRGSSHTVTIGAGGTGSAVSSVHDKGTNGGNSVFSSITSTGGGAGGAGNSNNNNS